jgi:hypothetical protein
MIVGEQLLGQCRFTDPTRTTNENPLLLEIAHNAGAMGLIGKLNMTPVYS